MNELLKNKQRRCSRVERHYEVECRFRGKTSAGFLIDISQSGARFRSGHRFNPSSELEIRFPKIESGKRWVRARVVRCAIAAAAIHTQTAIRFLPRKENERRVIAKILRRSHELNRDSTVSQLFIGSNNFYAVMAAVLVVSLLVIVVRQWVLN